MKVKVEVLQQKLCTFTVECDDILDCTSFIEVQGLIGKIPFDELPEEFPDAQMTTNYSRTYAVLETNPQC